MSKTEDIIRDFQEKEAIRANLTPKKVVDAELEKETTRVMPEVVMTEKEVKTFIEKRESRDELFYLKQNIISLKQDLVKIKKILDSLTEKPKDNDTKESQPILS